MMRYLKINVQKCIEQEILTYCSHFMTNLVYKKYGCKSTKQCNEQKRSNQQILNSKSSKYKMKLFKVSSEYKQKLKVFVESVNFKKQ